MGKWARAVLCLAVMVLAMPATAAAQDQVKPAKDVLQQTIEVGRPWWKKLVRGTARVVTLGAVQAADTLKQGQPFDLAWDHNGLDTDGYQVFINTALSATVGVAALVNGTAKQAYPSGLTKGTYTFVVKAYGPGGEGVSAPLTASVTAGNPSAPGQVRIIKGP